MNLIGSAGIPTLSNIQPLREIFSFLLAVAFIFRVVLAKGLFKI